jgi:hypothetical protein
MLSRLSSRRQALHKANKCRLIDLPLTHHRFKSPPSRANESAISFGFNSGVFQHNRRRVELRQPIGGGRTPKFTRAGVDCEGRLSQHRVVATWRIIAGRNRHDS